MTDYDLSHRHAFSWQSDSPIKPVSRMDGYPEIPRTISTLISAVDSPCTNLITDCYIHIHYDAILRLEKSFCDINALSSIRS